MGQGIQEKLSKNLWNAAFKKIWSDIVCLGRFHFKFLKGCLPKILLGPSFSENRIKL